MLLPHLTEEVLESMFLNGLDADIQVEVLCFEPQGLVQMLKAVQRGELGRHNKGETSLHITPLGTNRHIDKLKLIDEQELTACRTKIQYYPRSRYNTKGLGGG